MKLTKADRFLWPDCGCCVEPGETYAVEDDGTARCITCHRDDERTQAKIRDKARARCCGAE